MQKPDPRHPKNGLILPIHTNMNLNKLKKKIANTFGKLQPVIQMNVLNKHCTI